MTEERWRGEVDATLEVLKERTHQQESICQGCRTNINGKFDGFDRRLRTLETRLAMFTGGAALLGALGGSLLSLLIK